MTLTAAPPTSTTGPARAQPTGAPLPRQIASLVWRNLLHIRRMPEMLTDVTIQPVMFVLLFAYVFGGSIQIPGVNYKEWLLPGIMAQTMTFSSFVVAVGLNTDINKGLMDRLRSLPISRASLLVARSLSSLIHSTIGVVVMSLTGLVVGWGIRDGILGGLAGFGLLLLFGFAMIWVGILIGCAMRTVEAVQGVMFVATFPLTFLANTFARTDVMPRWLRLAAEWNPISALVQAMRELWGNDGLPLPGDAALPLRHPVIATLLWTVGLTLILAPLALRAFNKRTSG